MDNYYFWASGNFDSWQMDGVSSDAAGRLCLDPGQARPVQDPYPPGGYAGRNYYNGSSFIRGEALGPVVETAEPFEQANPSWIAETPPGAWLEMLVRARLDDRWTKWYSLGVWTSAEQGAVSRHSIPGQADEDGDLQVDTLKLRSGRRAAAFQLKLALFSEASGAGPRVRRAAAAVLPGAGPTLAPDPALWGRELAVPQCSQMVYRDGGDVWCSPTSVSMVLGYWAGQTGACERGVRTAVAGVYDWQYDGHGNWPFNVAYAGAQGLEGGLVCLAGLAQVERLTAAGIPVIVSFAWKDGELPNAPIGHSNGHLAVVTGFDGQGNPIVNDPAASSDDGVRRTYPRDAFEAVWVKRGGVAYLLAPPGTTIPGLE